MKRESFIKSRRGDWQRYEVLINSMQNKREGSWTGDNVSELSRLYRSICYDLSLVQSREWGSRLEDYLNDLVAHGHNCLYRSSPVSLYGIIDFIAVGFPRMLRRRWQPFLLAAALFLIPLIVSVFVGLTRPDLSAIVCGEEVLQQSIDSFSKDMYQQADWDYTGQRSFMFGFYVNNNTGIAFRAFALEPFAYSSARPRGSGRYWNVLRAVVQWNFHRYGSGGNSGCGRAGCHKLQQLCHYAWSV